MAAIPASDTVKEVDPEGWIRATPERGRLWLAQTPQAFRTDILTRAHRAAARDGFVGTDDAVLVERLGERVYVVPSSPRNRKITTPEDLDWAEWVLSAGKAPR